jgi:hypothetical protein
MKKIILALMGIAASLITTQASSIFSDSFNYPDGSIVASSGGIWIANSGSTSGLCLVSNQTLIVSSSRGEDIAHQLGSIYTTNGPVTALYASFTLKCTGLPTAAGTYFTHFTGTNVFGLSGFRARLWAATTNNAGGATDTSGNFYLYMVNSLGSTTNGGQWTTALATNVTYTIVTKYVLATGSSTLWINPSSESDTSVTDPVPVPYDINASGISTNGPINISHYSFRQASGEGTMLINGLKVGTAFSDVAGANTAPTISPIPNQNTPASTAIGPIGFTVGDAETPAGSLIVSNASSNPSLVPTANIILGGSDASRTVSVTPAAGQQGSSTITIYVSDGVNVSSTSFLLTVGAPSISAIANVILYSNTVTAAIPFTMSDSENDSLTLTSTSSNPSLIPTANVAITGTGLSRTFTVTPLPNQTGVSTITFSVTDGFNTNSTSFVVSVSPKYGVIFADTFSYDDFLQDTALLGAVWDATGYNSPWGHASGTNYDLLVINGAAQLTSARSEDLAANLTNSPFATTNGVVLYASFSITFSNVPTAAGDYFFHFQDTTIGTTFRDKLYACASNAAPGHLRIGIANAANNFTAQFPLDLATNQSYLVVTRYNSGTGESVLWVNPANESSTNAAGLDATTTAITGAVGLRQSDGIGTSYLDNLIVGTSFSDVATVSVTPVPLNIQASAGSVTLTWSDASFSLQSSTNVAGPYSTIPAAAGLTSYVDGVTNAAIFYRLYHP